MAKNKDPAVLFYTSDFLSGCALMDMRERGQYITLLCLQRERGHMTMQEIEKIVGEPTGEVMSKFQTDDDGKYFNHRMEREIEKRNIRCQRQKENISKRWNKKDNTFGDAGVDTMVIPNEYHGNTMVLPTGYHGITNVLPREKEEGFPLVPPSPSPPKTPVTPTPYNPPSPEEKERRAREVGATKFDLFWKAYPKKVGKEAARKAFSKVKVPVESLLTAIERQKCSEQWTTENGRFIPNPATWLNQGRWEDELAAPESKYHSKPGYGVQRHGDALTDFEREAIARMMEEDE